VVEHTVEFGRGAERPRAEQRPARSLRARALREAPPRGLSRRARGRRNAGLAPDATVYTPSIPDIKQLYDVGKNETGIFGIDCETIWLTTLIGFPCGSMLSPANTEQDRLNLQQVNLVYNLLLELAANAVNDLSPDQ
jgi:hypothetical protein